MNNEPPWKLWEKNVQMISELADQLRSYADRARGGVRLSEEWLTNVLDGDGQLARNVLRAAGFTPPPATEWTTGKGMRRMDDVGYLPNLSDRLTDVLDYYDPA